MLATYLIVKSIRYNVAIVILRKFKSKDLPGFEIANKFNEECSHYD